MLRSRGVLLIALSPRRLGRWWLSAPSLSTKDAVRVASSTQLTRGGKELPDVVVEAWLTWEKQRHGSESNCFLASSACVHDVLSRIPALEQKNTNQATANEFGIVATETSSDSAPVEPPSTSVGALYDALRDTACRCISTARGPHSRSSLEAVFVHLCKFTPLFLQLNTTAGHLALLAAYCGSAAKVEAETFPVASVAGPYMQRVLRQVRVSWQPWVTPTQKERLLTCCSLNGAPTPCNKLLVLSSEDARWLPPCSTNTKSETGGAIHKANACFLSEPRQTPETERERNWRVLLESVPFFYVSAERVRAELLRQHPSEGARLWALWLREVPTDAIERGATRADAASTTNHATERRSCADRPDDDEPYLEVAADGRAVRTPSTELCLQRGCPGRLIYGHQQGTSAALRERYGLTQNTHFGPELMHNATALLASVVPTVPTSLRDVRQLFSMQQRQLECARRPPTRDAGVASAAKSSSLFATNEFFFPCVEVLLDHPDLSFALQLRDRVNGVSRAGLPSPLSPEHNRRAHRCTDDSVEMQLHPAFAHELRGVADVALQALRCARPIRTAADAHADFPVCGEDASVDLPVVPISLHIHRFDSLADTVPSSLLAQMHCPTQTARPEREGVVCVSCAMRSRALTDHDKRSTGRELVFAFSREFQRVDVVVVSAECSPTLLTELSEIASKPEAALRRAASLETAVCDVPCTLGALARLFCHDAVVRLVPSRMITRTPLESMGLARFFGALPDAALASLCTLQHVACYAGYPMGDKTSTGQDADLLLAAQANRRHAVRLTRSSRQKNEEDAQDGADGGGGGSLMKEVYDAASLVVAASLLLQDRQKEEHLLHHLNLRYPYSQVRQQCVDGGCTPAFADWLRTWAVVEHAMYDYNIAVRLSRCMHWLRTLPTTLGSSLLNVEETCGTGVARLPLSSGAARDALRSLVAAYGPEPFPATGGKASLQVRDAALSETAAATEMLNKSTPLSTPTTVSVPPLTDGNNNNNENSTPPPSSAVRDEQEALDATLYDALLRDAAALEQTTATTTPPLAVGSVGVQTKEDERTGAPSAPAVPSPGADPAAVTDPSQEQDTLQFYLSTVLGGDGATTPPAMTPPPPPPIAPPPSPTDDGFVATTADRPAAPLQIPRGFLFGPSSLSSSRRANAAGNGRPHGVPGPPMPPRPLFSPADPASGQSTSWRPSCSNEGFSHPPVSRIPDLSSRPSSHRPSATSPPAAGSAPSVAHFDPFAAWAATAGPNAAHQRSQHPTAGSAPPLFSPLLPPPLPPPLPPIPPPMPSAATPATAAFAAGSTADFLGKVSDAERLRLASLIVDVLRGSWSPSPPPPQP